MARPDVIEVELGAIPTPRRPLFRKWLKSSSWFLLTPDDRTALQGVLQEVFETYVVQAFNGLADGKQA